MSTKKKNEFVGKFVVVATKSRPWSVVAGTVESIDGDLVVLTDARMILYWSTDCKGLIGVARTGVHSGRVSPPAKVRVSGVEHVILATDEAKASIEKEPWS
jgi:hypothetical protein